jgi:hypothetical protein
MSFSWPIIKHHASDVNAGSSISKTSNRMLRTSRSSQTTKLNMPFLVLAGEKASGTFLIDQAKLVATNVSGTGVQGSGHWLRRKLLTR